MMANATPAVPLATPTPLSVQPSVARPAVHPPPQPEPRPDPAPEPIPGRLAALFVTDGGWQTALSRCLAGLAMTAAFGVALGVRDGGASIFAHGLWAAAAPAAILAFGVPALYIVLALIDAPLGALDVARAAGRGTAALGTCLVGLGPLTALFIVSSQTRMWGAFIGLCAMIFAGLVGVGHFHVVLRQQLSGAPSAKRSAAMLAVTLFGVLATLAAARIWIGELPIFGGGQ
jgi:hypothetical protein